MMKVRMIKMRTKRKGKRPKKKVRTRTKVLTRNKVRPLVTMRIKKEKYASTGT
jgi:hypothetical protein